MRASGRSLKRWKMKILSFRLEIPGSLTRETAVLEHAEQLGGSDATALKESAGLGNLEAVVRPVEKESALEAWLGLRSREARTFLVQEDYVELKRGVWRWEVLERGNIWAFLPPW